MEFNFEAKNLSHLWDDKHLSQELFPAWINTLRKQAREKLLATGLPSRKSEEWKYTNLKILTSIPFTKAKEISSNTLDEISQWINSDSETLLFFVDGLLSECSPAYEKQGVDILPLRKACESNYGSRIRELISCFNQISSTPFTSLNDAMLDEGLYIRINEGMEIEKPLHIVNFTTASNSPRAAITRIFIDLQPNSSLKVIQSYLCSKDQQTDDFENSLTDIFLGENARLTHFKLQSSEERNCHISQLRAIVGRSAYLNTFVASNGGQLARHENAISLSQEGASCQQNGLYLGYARRHIDHHTSVMHAKPYTTSKQVYKGLLTGASRGVFNGRVHVAKGSVKASAHQLNKNLVLSDDAEIDTKPQLEIDNDDVKCSHGATVGQLRADELFYLLSRGIKQPVAKTMLCRAFTDEILFTIDDKALRQRFSRWLSLNLEKFVV